MNLVDKLLERVIETREERVARFKRENGQKWIEQGSMLLERRKALGITRAEISRETRIGYSRLTRLEQGEAVIDAEIIYRSYEMALDRIEATRECERLLEQIRLLQNSPDNEDEQLD